MIRTILAGLVGGLALYMVGFIFWGTPLSALAFSKVDATRSAAVQLALSQNLTEAGTGTYLIPDPSSQQGTTSFGQGPIATVHFNTSGFPVVDAGALTAGLVLALVVGLLIAFALAVVAPRLPAFADRARLVIVAATAILAWTHLGQPLFNHAPWGHFIYLFVSDLIGFIACGLIVAKMLPVRGLAAEAH